MFLVITISLGLVGEALAKTVYVIRAHNSVPVQIRAYDVQGDTLVLLADTTIPSISPGVMDMTIRS